MPFGPPRPIPPLEATRTPLMPPIAEPPQAARKAPLNLARIISFARRRPLEAYAPALLDTLVLPHLRLAPGLDVEERHLTGQNHCVPLSSSNDWARTYAIQHGISHTYPHLLA